jgi:1-deoxy-D-xylulose-5-phosphate reductoisomerase
MKLPIAFALNSRVKETILPHVDLLGMGAIEFLPITSQRYPIWEIKQHLLDNPHLGVVVNSANEEAIKKFERDESDFFGMGKIVLDAYKKFEDVRAKDIKEIIEIDREVRKYIKE